MQVTRIAIGGTVALFAAAIATMIVKIDFRLAAIIVDFLQKFFQIIKGLQVPWNDAEFKPGTGFLGDLNIIFSDFMFKPKNMEMIE